MARTRQTFDRPGLKRWRFVDNEAAGQRRRRSRETAIIHGDYHMEVLWRVFEQLHFNLVCSGLHLDLVAPHVAQPGL